jgi:Ca2+-binding RTX toxin-like protein
MQAGVPRIGLVAVATMVAVLGMSMIAEARVFSGSGKANRVNGTKKADTIRLRAGNDIARGRGGGDRLFGGAGRDRLLGGAGADRLLGGAGNDRLHGGKGRDRLSGGGGNDTLNSVDKRKDALVSGGAGKNTCRIDSIDLSVVRGCATIVTAPSGGSGPGGTPPGGNLPGGTPGGGSAGGLTLTSADGLQCASQLPTCNYTLSGSGADSPLGTVSGGGGVTTAGGSLTTSGEDWSALGLYGCTADGYLRVTIGSHLLDVPVDCTASGTGAPGPPDAGGTSLPG